MENNFTFEKLINADYHEVAIRQLEKLGNFWIGPDVSLEKKITIPPLGLVTDVNLKINKSDFPEVDINRDSISFLNWSVRSCLAQSGIEIRFNGITLLNDTFKRINEGESVLMPVDIINNSKRPIELEGKVMRFFWTNESKRLRGDQLHETLSADLSIEGQEGREWSFRSTDSESGAIDSSVILSLKGKFYIPESKEILKINNKNELNTVLKEIPENFNMEFCIGETTKVKLGKDIICVINTGINEQGQSHIHSPLIDPGFEGKIRTEAIGGLNSIQLFLYKNN